MKAGAFKIVPFKNPSGVSVFRLSGWDKEGQRVRRNFQTEAEAIAERQRLEIEIANLPAETPMVRTTLSLDQAREAERAFAALGGKSLLAAVDFYLKNWTDPLNRTAVKDAVPLFLRDRELAGDRPDTRRDLKNRVGQLVKIMPDRLVSDISHAHLEPIIHRAGRSGQTANNDRAAFSWFFSWAIEKRYATSNPALAVTKVKVDNEPEILPLEMVKKLISAAAEYKDGICLPYVVLSLFCAIRPREIERLTWDQIDLASQTVEIGKEQAKKRSRRVVAISDNAFKWLAAHALKRLPIVGPNFRKNFDAVKAAAGFRIWNMSAEDSKGRAEWIPDAMRHTAISYFLGKCGDKEKTATWAGNSSEVISEHYLDLVKGKAVDEFWSIAPAKFKKKIIRLVNEMPRAAAG